MGDAEEGCTRKFLIESVKENENDKTAAINQIDNNGN